MKRFLMALLGLFSALYLLNPSMGVFELIPDNLPFIGNIDEALAATLLLGVLRYFGLDLTKSLGKRSSKSP